MPRFTLYPLTAIGMVVLVVMVTLLAMGLGLLSVAAAPLRQFPTSSVVVVSDPPPPDLPGQFSERTLLQPNLLDPDPFWRSPTFDDSSWLDAYPAATLPGWGSPVGGSAPPADFIWGGLPGAGPDANGRFTIPTNPSPQFLFLRKNFCIPLNTAVNSVAATPLSLQVAATPGSAAVAYNGTTFFTGLAGDETGSVYSLSLDPALFNPLRRLGRNTLALRVRDDVADTQAAVAYGITFTYSIDPLAITVNSNPNPSNAGGVVDFSQTNTGLSGDVPYTFDWNFGDGTSSNAAAPAKIYTTPGTYTVILTMTDRFGCPSAPVSYTHTVLPVPVANFSSLTYSVAEGGGNAIITVILDAPSTGPVVVAYTTSNGTATAPEDYSASSGSLTFPPGVISQTFTVPIVDDSLDEADETILLTLSAVSGVTIGPINPATLTIVDDDLPPASPTPTATPTAGARSDEKQEEDDHDDGPQPTATPLPPPPLATAMPSPSPTPGGPSYLPETGLLEQTLPAETAPAFGPGAWLGGFSAGSILLLLAGYGLVRRRLGRRN